MPFQPIPLASQSFSPTVGPTLNKGQTLAGLFPLGVLDPPQPGERFDLTSVYLPIVVQAVQGAGPSSTPSVVYLTAQLFLSGVLVFQQGVSVPVPAMGASTNNFAGSTAIAASLPNAVSFRTGQTLKLGCTALIDAPLAALYVTAGAIMADPTTGNTTPLPGALGYMIVADEQPVVTQ